MISNNYILAYIFLNDHLFKRNGLWSIVSNLVSVDAH